MAEDDRPSLLIADDDPVVAAMLSMSLEEYFRVVAAATDSEEAIELAKTCEPDAALLDVDMPKGGGIRAVEGIGEVSPRTAIVVLSADESDALVRELILAGATAYRRKGTAPNGLAESVTESITAHANARLAQH
jgi:DNA-binding NarL/FixJ family response regulator